MHHFGVAQRQAQELYNQSHSINQSGAAEEDIPAWARKFFQFFKALESNTSASAQAAELATQRRNVATSVMGRQATLRPHPGSVPVQLHTKTSGRKNGNVSGSAQQRQQTVGNFETERLNDDAMQERLVKGIDDAGNHPPSQRSQTQQNGTRCHNVDNPSAENNLPNARYLSVSNAFQHLGGLTDAISQAFLNPPPPPPRTVTDIMNDFARSSEQLYIAESRSFSVGIEFWNNVLQDFVAEQAALSAQTSHD